MGLFSSSSSPSSPENSNGANPTPSSSQSPPSSKSEENSPDPHTLNSSSPLLENYDYSFNMAANRVILGTAAFALVGASYSVVRSLIQAPTTGGGALIDRPSPELAEETIGIDQRSGLVKEPHHGSSAASRATGIGGNASSGTGSMLEAAAEASAGKKFAPPPGPAALMGGLTTGVIGGLFFGVREYLVVPFFISQGLREPYPQNQSLFAITPKFSPSSIPTSSTSPGSSLTTDEIFAQQVDEFWRLRKEIKPTQWTDNWKETMLSAFGAGGLLNGFMRGPSRIIPGALTTSVIFTFGQFSLNGLSIFHAWATTSKSPSSSSSPSKFDFSSSTREDLPEIRKRIEAERDLVGPPLPHGGEKVWPQMRDAKEWEKNVDKELEEEEAKLKSQTKTVVDDSSTSEGQDKDISELDWKNDPSQRPKGLIDPRTLPTWQRIKHNLRAISPIHKLDPEEVAELKKSGKIYAKGGAEKVALGPQRPKRGLEGDVEEDVRDVEGDVKDWTGWKTLKLMGIGVWDWKDGDNEEKKKMGEEGKDR